MTTLQNEAAMKRLIPILCAAAIFGVSCGPRWGAVIVTTTPEGADVYDYEKFFSKSPATMIYGPSSSGKCVRAKVKAMKDGYSETFEMIDVCPRYRSEDRAVAKAKKLHLALQPKYYVTVQVESEPSGANIYGGDGKYWGRTPALLSMTRDSPTCFNYQAVAKMNGWEDTPGSWRICPKFRSREEASQSPERAMFMMKATPQTPVQAEIRVTSEPDGASVYADGQYWGTTPYVGRVSFASPTATISLRIEKAGWITKTEMLSPGIDRVHVVLQPSNAAPR